MVNKKYVYKKVADNYSHFDDIILYCFLLLSGTSDLEFGLKVTSLYLLELKGDDKEWKI